MYYNYRIDNRVYEEPAAILFTSAARKDCVPPPPVGLSWDSPHPALESVRAGGRTLTSEPKFFGSTGYQICLPMVLRELRYKKALRFLAILGIVWETFLKNRYCCSQLPGSLSCVS